MEDYFKFLLQRESVGDAQYHPSKITLLAVKDTTSAIRKIRDAILEHNIIDFSKKTYKS